VKLKSKEPKEPKEKKKSEPKPRKSGEKSKPILVHADVSPAATPPILVSEVAAEKPANGFTNGTIVESVSLRFDPSDDMIRARAYELFVKRGHQHGHHLDDWLAAERELKTRDRTA